MELKYRAAARAQSHNPSMDRLQKVNQTHSPYFPVSYELQKKAKQQLVNSSPSFKLHEGGWLARRLTYPNYRFLSKAADFCADPAYGLTSFVATVTRSFSKPESECLLTIQKRLPCTVARLSFSKLCTESFRHYRYPRVIRSLGHVMWCARKVVRLIEHPFGTVGRGKSKLVKRAFGKQLVKCL